jgi:hypothetical protein
MAPTWPERCCTNNLSDLNVSAAPRRRTMRFRQVDESTSLFSLQLPSRDCLLQTGSLTGCRLVTRKVAGEAIQLRCDQAAQSEDDRERAENHADHRNPPRHPDALQYAHRGRQDKTQENCERYWYEDLPTNVKRSSQ